MKGSGNALMAPMKIVDLHDWMLGLPHAQDIHIITIIHKRLVESNSNSISLCSLLYTRSGTSSGSMMLHGGTWHHNV